MSVPAASRVLVVDDDISVRQLLRTFLERQGLIVYEAGNGTELFAALKRHSIDLITLDLNLGGQDGLAVVRDIRAKFDIPIIIVSAKTEDVDRIIGLELGADDYIVKPFNLREVLARIRAVLRRYERPSQDTAGGTINFGDFRFDLGSRELHRRGGDPVALTTAEYKLLEIFARRPSRVLSRDTLMDLLKGHEASPYDRSIDTLVGRLRKKIEPDPETPSLVKTVRGVGYVFTPPTRQARDA